MTKRRHLKLVALRGETLRDEMHAFDGDMELDEALEQITGQLRAQPDLTKERARALVAAWLRDLSKEPRQ
jgi:hypothetical protein